MADIIKLLSDNLANQIAAGEVVQRPASIVKELLENSVDAGSKSIRLIVKEAGKALVQVTDDGSGMSETDARMCFERHATSKISSSDDLFAIRTMGFRGEAMASIAAVAQVEMKTRKADNDLGTSIVIEGGEVKSQEPCQTAVGTTILVKNLFFNVPARRNFLKSTAVEMRHILDEFQRVALAHPDIFFSLHHNGVEVCHLPKGNLRQRAAALFGQPILPKLLPVEQDTDMVRISGLVGKPETARKTRGEQYFFVNKRFIKSNYLNHAIMEAHEGLLPKETFPIYVIFLEIDPSRIDVNVHPTKQEIKFDDEKIIYNYLKVSVRHSLGQYALSPTLDFDQEVAIGHGSPKPKLRPEFEVPPPRGMSPKKEGNPLEERNLRHWETLYKGLEVLGSKVSADDEEEPSREEAERTPYMPTFPTPPPSREEEFTVMPSLADEHRSFGEGGKLPYQIHGRYLVSQIRSGFMLIDQQAAHERILYERFLKIMERQQPPVQQLLFPVSLRLSVQDAELLKEIITEVNALGIDVRDFGGNTFVVHGMPPELKAGSEESVLESLLEQYRLSAALRLNPREVLARSLARESAVKRGQELSVQEMQELIDKLFACEVPHKSPSGKKCVVTFGMDELEKKFG